MMKSDEKYQVPAWMRPLLPLLCNTGGNDPEELLNDTETTASANVVRYVLIVAVRSQVDLLQLLYRKGLLRTEIPGGFSPEEAQALLDNLVRSHISKALSGDGAAVSACLPPHCGLFSADGLSGGTYTTTSRFSRPGERCTSHKTFCRRRQKLLRLPPDNCPVTW
ncbi:hypothetical protein ACRWYK_22735 [Escherichia coli]